MSNIAIYACQFTMQGNFSNSNAFEVAFLFGWLISPYWLEGRNELYFTKKQLSTST